MTFTFDAYSSLLLPFFLQGVVVSVVLLTRGRRHGTVADGWLALLLLLHTVRLAQWMLGFGGWYDAHNALSTFMFYFPFSNWLALGPTLYFYFRSLTNQNFRFGRRELLHFAPALLYLGWRLVVFGVDVGWEHGLRGIPFPYHFGTKGRLAVVQEGVGSWVEALSWALASGAAVGVARLVAALALFSVIQLWMDFVTRSAAATAPHRGGERTSLDRGGGIAEHGIDHRRAETRNPPPPPVVAR